MNVRHVAIHFISFQSVHQIWKVKVVDVNMCVLISYPSSVPPLIITIISAYPLHPPYPPPLPSVYQRYSHYKYNQAISHGSALLRLDIVKSI